MPQEHFLIDNPFPSPPSRPVFFVPGWGFDGRILALADKELPWLAPAGGFDPRTFGKDLLAWLDENQVARFDLIGWSMGAHCALDFARRHPERISSLTLLSLRRQWPAAEIEAIRTALDHDPREFLVSFYRKCFLGHKHAYDRFVRQLQPSYLRETDVSLLRKGLAYLASARLLPPPACETQCVQGGRDIIAPLSESAQLPGARHVVLPRAGHPVFFDKDFNRPALQRKETIRRRFSKAAATYDAHADVQKALARKLVSEFAPDGPAASVLEIGCGTGTYTALLAERYREARITALDFSEEMLRAARRKVGNRSTVDFVCEDAEVFLAGSRRRFDLVTANATMQWFESLDNAIAGIKNNLRPGGVFWGSIFGPQTLIELEQGMQHVLQGKTHVPSSRFWTKAEVHTLLDRHFDAVHLDEWRPTRRYGSLQAMLRHFKMTGTGGWHPGSPLLTRRQLNRLDRWFLDELGEYRALFQIFLMRCA